MCADIGNRMILYHRNFVAHADHTEPMSNDEDGFPLGEVPDCFVNLQLIFRIGGTRRFIQNFLKLPVQWQFSAFHRPKSGNRNFRLLCHIRRGGT